MDRKTYEFPLRLKSIEENGYFAGYASVFNVEDSHSDIDMPLSESVEQYNISILNVSDQVVRETDVATNSYNYTESMQIEDFGASQNSIKAMVYQFSENVGIGQEVEEAFSF